MKQISVVAIILLLVAAGGFFLRDRSARASLRDTEKQVGTLSNEVAKATTIVMMHSATNSQLTKQLATATDRSAALSNRLARVSEDLKHSQQEHSAARADLEKQTQKASAGELRIAELENERRASQGMIDGRNMEISRLTARLRDADAERVAFNARLQKAEADVVRLQLDLTDEDALRAQLKRLNRQWQPVGFARTPNVTPDDKGAKGLTAKVDSQAKGYYLQMQPDGTVKILPPLEAAGATGK